MRATTFFLLLCLGMIVFIIIVPKNNKEMAIEKVALNNTETGNSSTLEITVFEMNPEIPLEKGEFQRLVFYIEERGFDFATCTKRFIFDDSSGNTHFMDIIKCAEIDTVAIIRVSVNCKDKSVFGYYISPTKAYLSFVEDPCLNKYKKITKQGCTEFCLYVDLMYPYIL
jgi:hypothetical protein